MKLSRWILASTVWLASSCTGSAVVKSTDGIRQTRIPRRIVIVGAGISGLAAVNHLAKFAHNSNIPVEITVLEAESTAGGRTFSLGSQAPVDPAFDFAQDEGAQFLSDGYPTTLRLLEEYKLKKQLKPWPNYVASVKNKKAVRLTTTDLRSYLKIMSEDSLAELPAAFARAAQAYPGMLTLPISDISRWSLLDRDPKAGGGIISTADWMADNYTPEGTNYFGSQFESFFFYKNSNASLATYLWLVGLSMRKDGDGNPLRSYTLLGGTGQLAMAMADSLGNLRSVHFHYGSPVQKIRETGDGKAEVEFTESGKFQTLTADYVIVTTPGPISRKILSGTHWAGSPVLENPYVSTVVVNVLTNQNWRGPKYPELNEIFLMHVPRFESQRLRLKHGAGIVAISVESGKSPEHLAELGSRELLGVHYTTERAAEFLGESKSHKVWTNQEIAQATFAELSIYFPNFDAKTAKYQIKRWPNALPMMRPGHIAELAHFWAEQESGFGGAIYLAGDETGFSTIESAAFSGEKTASLIEGKIRH